MVIIFIDKEQFLLLPTLGLVFHEGIFLTLGFMSLCLSIRLRKPGPEEQEEN